MVSHPNRGRNTVWADQRLSENMLGVGNEGFLVSRSVRGRTTWTVQTDPPLTNMSREPRETGWCGTTNDVSVTAHGRVTIVRIAAGGARVQVKHLAGQS